MNAPLVFLGISVIFFVIATMVFIRWQQRRDPGVAKVASAGFQQVCESCQQTMAISYASLVPLAPVEMGLAVRSKPALLGRKLSEYECRHCHALHCFDMTGKKLEYVGYNIYVSHTHAGRCAECNTMLEAAPWAGGAYENAIKKAPRDNPKVGLLCEFCASVCCLQCCSTFDKTKEDDSAFLCPRCTRRGVSKVMTAL